MKTVLFVDKGEGGVWSSFLRYGFIFNEFRDRGLLEVCNWHPGGRSVRAAVPTLPSIIGDEQDWIAIIVTDLRKNDAEQVGDAHFDNPFDFPDSFGRPLSHTVEESAHPLVRLTQMLGGIPEKAELVTTRVSEAGGAAAGDGARAGGPASLGDLPDDRPVTHDEVRILRSDAHYDLLARYRLGVPRPQRIICITPRDVDEDLAASRDQDLFHEQRESGDGLDSTVLRLSADTQFWDRNDYPPSARFLVCDRVIPARTTGLRTPLSRRETEEDAKERDRREWFHFWMSVMTVATAGEDALNLRPCRVHRVGVTFDQEAMGEQFDRRYTEWSCAREQVGQQIETERAVFANREHTSSPTPDCETQIAVSFDMATDEEAFADPQVVEILRDRPEPDASVWTREFRRVGEKFREALKTPRRSLRAATAVFRGMVQPSEDELEGCILSTNQREDLEEEARKTELELAEGAGRPFFAQAAYDSVLAEGDKEVRSTIASRPVPRAVWICLVGCVLSLVLGGLPYAFGWVDRTTVIPVALACVTGGVGVLAAALGIAVRWQRRRVRASYGEFNRELGSVYDQIKSETADASHRISAYATFGRQWAVLERQRHLDGPTPTRHLRWLVERDALLKARTDDLVRVAGSCSINREAFSDAQSMTWGLVERNLASEGFFDFYPPIPVERPLFSGDNLVGMVMVPYGFVESLVIEQIETH